MMLKCLKAGLAAASLVIGAGSAQAQDADTIVATVNGTEITLGHVLMVAQGLPEQYQQLPDNVLWDGIIDQLIQQTVLAQTGNEARSQRLALALENEERALRAAEAVDEISDAAATEAAVLEAYEAQFAEGGGVEYNASHILVPTEEEAAALTEQARDGAEFAGLAREHSTGPSGPNGGELGWFGEGMMVAPFEAAVADMEVAAISDPVQTQFGWHVIRLNDKRVQDAPPLDQVRAQLTDEVRNAAIQSRIQDLLENGEIDRIGTDEINPAVIRDLTILE